MVTLETWVALGSLAMSGMFVALMFSFYIFLVGPEGRGPDVTADPGALLIQTISISGAPSLILAGTGTGYITGARQQECWSCSHYYWSSHYDRNADAC